MTLKFCGIVTFFIFPMIITVSQTSISKCLSDMDIEMPLSKTARTNLYIGEQAFTISLLKALNKTSKNENVFFSPYSTYHALLLAYFGSRGNTEYELSKALNLEWASNKLDIMQAYRIEKSLRNRRAKSSPVIFRSVDKIYTSLETNLTNCIQQLFPEELEKIDFKQNSENSRIHINNFVANVTNNYIKDILDESSITHATNLVLTNAAFFKGQWASKFNADDTKPAVFFTTSEQHNVVEMMSKKGFFNHAVNERLGCHILEIPFIKDEEEGGISMMVFLPPFTSNGLENILSRLTPSEMESVFNEGTSREVELLLPKFNFEKSYKLVSILSDLGISELFSPHANLTGFANGINLNLDEIVHKSKIEVNEDGSTAAAATVLFSFRSSRPSEPAQFHCDHPFLFVLYDSKSKAILFAGIYRGPE